MTYIDLINAVWELREQGGVITMYEHDLYSYLLHKCNRLSWKNPFYQSSSIMCAVLGINRNALMDRRRKLKQLGLITYREGTAKTRPAEYRILMVDSSRYLDTATGGPKVKQKKCSKQVHIQKAITGRCSHLLPREGERNRCTGIF